MTSLTLLDKEHAQLVIALDKLYGYIKTSNIQQILGRPTVDLRNINTVSILNSHGRCEIRIRRLEGVLDLWYRVK